MRFHRDEDGAVAVVVSISLLAIVAMMALVIDGGRIYDERGDAQIAADAAALAAAWAACTGGTASSAGLAAADANGYDNDGVTNSVTIASGGAGYIATISTTIDSTFAAALETDTMQTAARAEASCAGGGGGYALFANSQNCQNAIDWSGSTTHIRGGVHTDRDLHVGGQTNIIEGRTTYATTIDAPADKITYLPAGSTPVHEPWDHPMPDPPASLTMDHFRGLSGVVANVTEKIDSGWLKDNTTYDDNTGVMQDGIYITTDDIDLSASDLSGKVTLVAGGVISLSGSSHVLEPYAEDVLAFSTYQHHKKLTNASNCSKAGIKFAGSTHDWEGIVYAPTSLVEMSGSSNTTLNGSIIAWTIKLNGSNIQINYSGSNTGDPFVALVH